MPNSSMCTAEVCEGVATSRTGVFARNGWMMPGGGKFVRTDCVASAEGVFARDG
jgi:hypothetical protein